MLTVHHLDNSRSHRILWLLEELELEYELVEYKRGRNMRAPATLRKLHPLGKVPLVTTDDGEVLAESGAVIETLVEAHGEHLRPPAGTDEFRRYRYFLHYAEGSMAPPLLVKLITGQLRTGPVPFFLKPISKAIASKIDAAFTDPELTTHLSFVNGELADRPYITGESFTAADVQMSFPVEAAEARVGYDDYPNLSAYVARLRERPAYKRAAERGGAPSFDY